jgi:hypothetical protein
LTADRLIKSREKKYFLAGNENILKRVMIFFLLYLDKALEILTFKCSERKYSKHVGNYFKKMILRPAQEFFTYMETSSLPVKGCKVWAYARRSGPLSRLLLYIYIQKCLCDNFALEILTFKCSEKMYSKQLDSTVGNDFKKIIYDFTSRSRIFHLYGDVIIAGEGLQSLDICSSLRAFE